MRGFFAVPLVCVLACGRTFIGRFEQCAEGDSRFCEIDGRLGAQQCSAQGYWGACVAASAHGGSGEAGGGGSGAGFAGSSRGGASPVGGFGGGGSGAASSGRSGATAVSAGNAGEGGTGGSPICEPTAENCVTSQDEDCDGLTPPCTGNIEFAFTAGNQGAQSPTGLAVNPAGEFALVGHAYGGINFGPPTPPIGPAGSADQFVAYFESSGTPRWNALYGDGLSQEFVGVAFDPGGDILVTGGLQGAVNYGQGLLSSANPGAVIAEFTSNGQIEWAKLITSTRTIVGMDVTATPQGNIANVGVFSGTVDLGGGPFTSDQGYLIGSYVALFDAQHSWLWNQRIGGEQSLALSVAAGAAGDVVVGGWFVRGVDFGQGTIIGSNSSNAFIAKYGVSGALQRSLVFAGKGVGSRVTSVATVSTGGWVAAGGFDVELDVGVGPMTGSSAAFVAKFDASGETLWSKSFDSTGFTMSANDVAVDPWGNILVCGALSGSTNGSISISSSGNGAFVLKLDPEGNVVWARSFDGDQDHYATLIGSDGSGNVYVAGRFGGTLEVGDQAFVSTGQGDIYVVKLAP